MSGQARRVQLGIAIGVAVAVVVNVAEVRPVRAGAETPVRSGKIDFVYRGHDMVKVPRGSFRIGSTAVQLERALELCAREVGERFEELACQSQFFEDELTPPRPISLFGFLMDRFEVTVGEYRACVAAGGCAIDPLLVAAPEPAPVGAVPLAGCTAPSPAAPPSTSTMTSPPSPSPAPGSSPSHPASSRLATQITENSRTGDPYHELPCRPWPRSCCTSGKCHPSATRSGAA